MGLNQLGRASRRIKIKHVTFNQQKIFKLSSKQQELRQKKKKKVNGKREIRWQKFNPRKQ